MLKTLENDHSTASFLSTYRLQEPACDAVHGLSKRLQPLWNALAEDRTHEVRELAKEIMEQKKASSPQESAAILGAWALAELRRGAIEAAKCLAEKSLACFKDQHMAHRILLTTCLARKEFAKAYNHLSNTPLPTSCQPWDHALTEQERHTALAAWAWQLGEWEQVADHLLIAFPDGLEQMPSSLQEDWFKLALYRGYADQAADAASSILPLLSESEADAMVQTMARSGWTNQALSLYELAYEHHRESELFRRRLVALNIKTGRLERAHVLSMSAPLKMAV